MFEVNVKNMTQGRRGGGGDQLGFGITMSSDLNVLSHFGTDQLMWPVPQRA